VSVHTCLPTLPKRGSTVASWRRLLRSVLHCSLDDLVGDRDCELMAGDNVATVVDAGPDARFGGSLAERREGLSVAREEIAEHPRNGDRRASMRGRIARMIWRGEDRLDLRVELERADRPIRVLRLPAGDGHVVESDIRQHESAGGARRIAVEPVF